MLYIILYSPLLQDLKISHYYAGAELSLGCGYIFIVVLGHGRLHAEVDLKSRHIAGLTSCISTLHNPVPTSKDVRTVACGESAWPFKRHEEHTSFSELGDQEPVLVCGSLKEVEQSPPVKATATRALAYRKLVMRA